MQDSIIIKFVEPAVDVFPRLTPVTNLQHADTFSQHHFKQSFLLFGGNQQNRHFVFLRRVGT